MSSSRRDVGQQAVVVCLNMYMQDTTQFRVESMLTFSSFCRNRS